MASTYSPNLRLELIGTGEQQGTWGSTTNTNLGTLLEEAIGGYVSVTVTDGADTTLSTNNGSADQSRNMTINLTGALTAARNVICPAIEKVYIVKNATTGGYAVTFKVSGQTGVSIPNGSTYILYVNGTDAVLATGTIAAQNSNNVSITGGSVTGITDLAVADGGTGASDAATARTNLGIGTIATQNANNVSITGGSITGITDLAIADGGTGASDAATARTNLGIGTMGTQNANAVAITGGTIVANASGISIRDADASNVMTIAVGSNLTANTTLTLTTGATTNRTIDISATNVTVSVAGAALIDDADAAAQRTTLGLGTIATQNANAVSITGGSVTGITDLAVADGGTGASDAGTARTNLGLAIGTNVQAYSARLGEIAALAPTLDNFIVGTGTSWSLETPASARTSLGLGTIATQNANAVSITGGSVTGITDITVSDGGTGVSSFTAYSVVVGGTTSTAALQTVSGTGTSGQVLTSAGAGAIPAWAAAPATSAVTSYTSGSGTWTIPSGKTVYHARLWAGGGSGGRGGASNAGACGGGGGAYFEEFGLITDLGSPGGTVSYSVGAGGTAVSTGGNGNPGGNTTFGSLTAYGGGGGNGNSGSGGGGGGGGEFAAGSVGGTSAGGSGGAFGGGTGGTNSGSAAASAWGGGGGGGAGVSSSVGGKSINGGGGGGGSNNYAGGSAVGSGGSGGAGSTTAPVSGSSPSGGGGAKGGNSGTSGAGGAGRIEIWVW